LTLLEAIKRYLLQMGNTRYSHKPVDRW